MGLDFWEAEAEPDWPFFLSLMGRRAEPPDLEPFFSFMPFPETTSGWVVERRRKRKNARHLIRAMLRGVEWFILYRPPKITLPVGEGEDEAQPPEKLTLGQPLPIKLLLPPPATTRCSYTPSFAPSPAPFV